MKQDKDNTQACEYLIRIIDHELSKPDPDMNLIHAYQVLLNKKTNGAYMPEPHRKKVELTELSRKYSRIIKQSEKQIAWKYQLRKTCTVLCSIIITISLLFGTVYAVSGISPVDILNRIGSSIIDWKPGTVDNIDGFTFIKNNIPTTYANIEQCVYVEKLDIYYPTWLPDNVDIESILLFDEPDNHKIVFHMNTDKVFVSVNFLDSPETIQQSDYQKIKCDNIDVYYAYANEMCYAHAVFDNIVYSFSATDLEIAEKIIIGMKKGTYQ